MHISNNLKFNQLHQVIACSWDDVDYEFGKFFDLLGINVDVTTERSESDFFLCIEGIEKNELIKLLEISNITNKDLKERKMSFEEYIEEIYSEDTKSCCIKEKEDNFKIISTLYKKIYKKNIKVIESLCGFDYFAIVISE